MNWIKLTVMFTFVAAAALMAEEPKQLAAARAEFAKAANPDEAARARYITTLARLREKLARGNGDWKAVDAEILLHPTPQDADAAALTKLRVGAWSSPRHDFLFRKDGTWTVTPVDPGTTHGTWRIEGNQYEERTIVQDAAPETSKYSIILLTAKDFISTDGTMVFYETKKGK